MLTSFPEIAFAGGNTETVKKGEARALTSIENATAALSDLAPVAVSGGSATHPRTAPVKAA